MIIVMTAGAAPADIDRVGAVSIDVLPVEIDRPLDPAFVNEVVHAVEAADQGGLATP